MKNVFDGLSLMDWQLQASDKGAKQIEKNDFHYKMQLED